MFEAKKFLIVILVAAVVGVPFVFREKNSSVIPVHGVETLVVITPHNESLRREYGAGFKKWYKAKTGKEVNVDWRYHGGGRDVARYVESVYANNFRLHWTENLHREWNSSAAAAFSARSEKMLDGDSLVAEVSREFFKSNVGCGIDIMFGAGLVESEIQASKGNLVPCGLLQERPDLFTDDTIPETFAGSRLWDRVGRWFGSALSSFGIIYNSEAILEDGITFFPRTWDDLGRQEFFGKLAIVDPTKSSSVLKAFDMLTQQKMQECFRGVTCGTDADDSQAKAHEEAAIGQGWLEALKLMQRIIANGRYFTDSATRPVVDVSAGNCLAGIAVDFYGFSEAQHLEDRGGSKRFRFCMPIGGGAPSPDPIGFFRGSQSPQLAKDFIEFIISEPGQKLLTFSIGAPGGPEKTTMRRGAILRTIYCDKENDRYRCDPTFNPYEAAGSFVIHDEWTMGIFGAIGQIMKMSFIDINRELSDAMAAIIAARAEGRLEDAENAYATLSDVSHISLDNVKSRIIPTLTSKNILKISAMQNEIRRHFKAQYLAAKKIANGAK